jgi:rod shape-determining protein MreD
LQGAIAGLSLGWLQDSLTSARPTHALGLAIVGILTARLQKQRYVQEDFISVALIVFGMVVVSETLMAVQWTLLTTAGVHAGDLVEPWVAGDGARSLSSIWLNHQKTTLTSAILSSLWAPALYLPLNVWWQHQEKKSERSEL